MWWEKGSRNQTQRSKIIKCDEKIKKKENEAKSKEYKREHKIKWGK